EKQQINHHPNGDGSEDDWRHWIKPDVIGPRNIRSGYAQDDYSDDREERAEQERELNVNDHQLETAREQKKLHDKPLNDDAVRRDAFSVFAPEKSQQPMIFTH